MMTLRSMLRLRSTAFIIGLACLAAIPGATQKTAKALIRVPVANLFSAPSADAGVVSQAIYGSEVTPLEQQEGFTHIRTLDSYTGWIRDQDLLPQSDPATHPFAQVRSLAANLYREPDVTKHAPVLVLPFEVHLEIIPQATPENEDYVHVRLLDQRDAWIDRGDVELNPRPLTISESIELAKRFLGITYTWGGGSSFGFDCSGFTQMLVRSRGIIIPRDADLQSAWSGVSAVDRKHLKPGDLLFFGKSPSSIIHTGMYIGKNRFIHDTTNGHPGVQISHIKQQPWQRLLVTARRVNEAAK
jgi:gamma-D-glutamyl-L-lysine dipeptidyl-peptidase